MSYLARIIINDNSRQMSLKGFRLYIKAKRKIHDNVGHKQHSTRSLQPHSLFVNLPQILTPPPPSPTTAILLHPATRAMADVKKRDVNCIENNISEIVYSDLLNSNVNSNHASDRFFIRSERPFYIFISFLSGFGLYSGHGLSFHEASRLHSDKAHW